MPTPKSGRKGAKAKNKRSPPKRGKKRCAPGEGSDESNRAADHDGGTKKMKGEMEGSGEEKISPFSVGTGYEGDMESNRGKVGEGSAKGEGSGSGAKGDDKGMNNPSPLTVSLVPARASILISSIPLLFPPPPFQPFDHITSTVSPHQKHFRRHIHLLTPVPPLEHPPTIRLAVQLLDLPG